MEDYKKEVIEDLKELLSENKEEIKDLSIDELRDLINDYRFADSVTGNGSGSYYFNAYKAQETINKRGILFDECFTEYVRDCGKDMGELLDKGAEAVDVWARCCVIDYMLTDDELNELRQEALEA